jgi:hypothetical protein
MVRLSRLLQSAFVLSIAIGITGCGIGGDPVSPVSTTSGGPAVKISGIVHGGQNPISGAYVQLYAVGTSGYGSGAYPLIATTTVTDGSTQSTISTSSSGAFNITGTYLCPSSTTQVYITAVGGDPGSISGTDPGVNTNIALMAALGNCGNLKSTTNIVINEVTTVAAVWALQGFIGFSATGSQASLYWNGGSTNGSTATTPTYTAATGFAVGSSSTNTQALANSFLVAQLLANTSTGGSPGNNNVTGNIKVEYGTVNLLANVLSSCINSGGGTEGDGTRCGSLFADVTPSGFGPYPQDTLQAAYTIARNPANNVSTVAGLAPATGAPFSPAAATFTDFTIGFQISGTYNGALASPGWIALDSYGDAWIYNMDSDGTGGANGATATSPFIPYLSEFDAIGNYLTSVRAYYLGGTLNDNGGSGSTGSTSAFSSNHMGKMVVDINNNVYANDALNGNLFAIKGSTGPISSTAPIEGVASAGVFSQNALAVNMSSVTAGSANIQNMALDGQGYLYITTGAAGSAPYGTTSGDIDQIPVSAFSASSAPSSITTIFVSSNQYSVAVDNTSPSAANGAPYLWTGNTGNCAGNTTSGSPTLATTSAYGDIFPINTTTAGTVTAGAEAAFKAVDSIGVASSSCSATNYPTSLANVNATFNGTTYAAAPIAEPYALAIDSTDSIWMVNAISAAAVAGTSAGQFQAVPEMSVSHMTPAYNAAGTTVSFSNIAEATGSSLSTPLPSSSTSGTDTYATFQAAVDGANNFWAIGGSSSYPAEFIYNGVGSGATATANYASGGGVTGITVTAGGTGYNAAPTVTISGGGGSGATATATISNGAVTAVTVVNMGTGYTSAPTVSFSTSNGITVASPTAGFVGSTCSSCSSSTGVNGRSTGTRKNIAIDRSGNIWLSGVSSSGNALVVIVGAATPVYTPIYPGHEGSLP